MKYFFIILFIISLFTGCSHTIKMGMLSTRNVDFSAEYVKGDVVKSSAELTFIIYIPIRLDDINIYEIIDKALLKKGYEFMTDVSINRSWFFTEIYNYVSFEVRGTGWYIKKNNYSINSINHKYYFSVVKIDDGYQLDSLEKPLNSY